MFFSEPEKKYYYELNYTGEINEIDEIPTQFSFSCFNEEVYYDPFEYRRDTYNENASKLTQFYIYGKAYVVFIGSLETLKQHLDQLLKPHELHLGSHFETLNNQ